MENDWRWSSIPIETTAPRINVYTHEWPTYRKVYYCCDTLFFNSERTPGEGRPNTIILGEKVKAVNGDFRGDNDHLVKDIFLCGCHPSINNNTFSDQTYIHGTIHVPIGRKDEYMSDYYWGKFHNIIDDITGIKKVTTMENDSHSTQNNYYDLQGRPVNNPVKGQLYIVNGKKILAK